MPIKEELLNQLRMAHDRIKEHPFRTNFDARHIKSYKNALYDLSEIWAKIIYETKFESIEEEKKYKAFGGWIHNYRARLQMYYDNMFPMTFFDYYEQMLQITHEYLDTGSMDRFYAIDEIIPQDNPNVYIWGVEKYEWVTEESIGIKSKLLPRYLPVKYRLIIDDDLVKEHINSGYNKVYETQEQRDAWFDFWLNETKPVLEALSKNNAKECAHPVYVSCIYR